jgi:hypothetical protein
MNASVEKLRRPATSVFVATTVMLSFISFWRAAAASLRRWAMAAPKPTAGGRLVPHEHGYLIQPRLTLGAGFPAPVDPEPLFGILAGVLFDDLIKHGGVGQRVSFVVAG